MLLSQLNLLCAAYRKAAGSLKQKLCQLGFSLIRTTIKALSRTLLPTENVQRQERRNQHVRQVHGLADAQVDGDTAERIGLLGGEAALLNQVPDHSEQRVAGGKRD